MTRDEIEAEIRALGYEVDVEPKMDPFATCVMAAARATNPEGHDVFASGFSASDAVYALWSVLVEEMS